MNQTIDAVKIWVYQKLFLVASLYTLMWYSSYCDKAFFFSSLLTDMVWSLFSITVIILIEIIVSIPTIGIFGLAIEGTRMMTAKGSYFILYSILAISTIATLWDTLAIFSITFFSEHETSLHLDILLKFFLLQLIGSTIGMSIYSYKIKLFKPLENE